MPQLSLALQEKPIVIPKNDRYFARTCTDEKLGYFTDFDPDRFMLAADGVSPFLSLHCIYTDRSLLKYIGTVFCLAPGMPWQCQLRGAIEPKTIGMDIEEAIDRLLEWKDEDEAFWRNEFSKWKTKDCNTTSIEPDSEKHCLI